MEKVLVRAIFNQKSGMFEVNIGNAGVTLSPDQFLTMASYLAKVGVSYEKWLKKGGK